MTAPGYSAGDRSVDELGSPPEGVGSGVRGPAAQPERTGPYVLWICPACGDPSECEPGEECEVCCEGTIERVEVVPASSLDALRGVAEELAEALRCVNDNFRGTKPRCGQKSALARFDALSAPSTGGEE